MLEPKTLARPYAIAIFEHAKQQGSLSEWLSLLLALAQFSKSEELNQWLKGNSPGEKKIQVLMQLLGDQPKDVLNAVNLLAEKKRLDLLPFICDQYDLYKRMHEEVKIAEVSSAYSLTAAQQENLQKFLSKKTGQQVKVVIEEDASLLGGVVIKIGDDVYDHSVKGKLNQLSQSLLTASV